MELSVSITKENTVSFPQHKHTTGEIMCYIKGSGKLVTEKGDFEFSQGTIIIIPPGIMHGSVSDNGFVNICIHSESIAPAYNIIKSHDNSFGDGTALANIIAHTYFSQNKGSPFLISLIQALDMFVRKSTDSSCVKQVEYVRSLIIENFTNPEFSISNKLCEIGYSEDHFRKLFKKSVGITPTQYMISLRINHADSLIATHGDSLKVGEIAYLSGFSDQLYFSRLYKKYRGISPVDKIKLTSKGQIL